MSIEAAYPLAKVACLYIAKAHKQGTIKRCKPFGTIKKENTTEMKETEIIIKALQKEFRVRANIVKNIHKVKPQIELSRKGLVISK